MAIIRVASSLIPRKWRDITKGITNGDVVIVDHYGDPTYKITSLEHRGDHGVLLYGYKLGHDQNVQTSIEGWENTVSQPGVRVWTHRYYRSATESKKMFGETVKINLQRTWTHEEWLLAIKVATPSPGTAQAISVEVPNNAANRLTEALRELKIDPPPHTEPAWWLLPSQAE